MAPSKTLHNREGLYYNCIAEPTASKYPTEAFYEHLVPETPPKSFQTDELGLGRATCLAAASYDRPMHFGDICRATDRDR